MPGTRPGATSSWRARSREWVGPGYGATVIDAGSTSRQNRSSSSGNRSGEISARISDRIASMSPARRTGGSPAPRYAAISRSTAASIDGGSRPTRIISTPARRWGHGSGDSTADRGGYGRRVQPRGGLLLPRLRDAHGAGEASPAEAAV